MERKSAGSARKRVDSPAVRSSSQKGSNGVAAIKAVDAKKPSKLLAIVNNIVCPLLLIIFAPLLCNLLTYLVTTPKLAPPTLQNLGNWMSEDPGGTLNAAVLSPGVLGSYKAAVFLLLFNFVALLVYWWPGPIKYGPTTEKGANPDYIDNGVAHNILFTAIFLIGSNGLGEYSLGVYDLGIIFLLFRPIVGACNLFGLLFCGFLYIKGLYKPSGPDSGSSGRGFIFDYYWGMELYPRIFGVDVKKFVNCRFSMTFWQIAGISFAYRSYIMHRKVDPAIVFCALSQYLYLVKFYIWEIGYMRSMDIIVDRAGFYETWGCITWVPAVYTFHTAVLVNSPSRLSWVEAGIIFASGLAGVGLNWMADEQRKYFRESNGTCLIWGQKPRSITARYVFENPKTGQREEKKTILLASGLWGMCRHPQYVFELMAAWSWGFLGAGGWTCPNGILPLFYAFYLTILLLHRMYRDEEKCFTKYGEDYVAYSKIVSYKLIPLIW
eukprot:gnl/MRDRNA2_/MRDRNA2_102886_c0_seq1.p1 gnl/MRDRNA2_/MRDRNA2_102886_c0~~gnl/MRDRNA2_/MRDRNA2_102886_c0_seq1.p1  ORF type:complete len:523 (-),score=42.20 gnl/MRDRNA2_/MRDRNA2_102886_c0_seq1:109-1587(-)